MFLARTVARLAVRRSLASKASAFNRAVDSVLVKPDLESPKQMVDDMLSDIRAAEEQYELLSESDAEAPVRDSEEHYSFGDYMREAARAQGGAVSADDFKELDQVSMDDLLKYYKMYLNAAEHEDMDWPAEEEEADNVIDVPSSVRPADRK
jgi:hypothetical protein